MSFTKFNNHLKPIAKGLRKRMSEAEVRLWVRICRKQINNLQFYRQKPIGKYIVDFYCPARKLIIEADGNQHGEDDQWVKDIERDKYLTARGFKVLRIANYDIFNNIEGVMENIDRETKRNTQNKDLIK